MNKELEKAYEPKKYEDAMYQKWEESGFFDPDVCIEKGVTDENAEAFSIVLPPPNVTGTLHMGHAAMLAIEDTMVRYHRMKGDKTLWVPGTDHAAVATESKVEGILIKEGMKKPKEVLGREKFLEKVNQFAQESHDTIVNQAKKMGTSMDWSREAYTLDNVRNKAVKQVFKRMYDDGLIYRGYRVINWSVKGQSTCSDDELVHVERPAKMYYFKYNKDFPITIATTRPETKLGDTAVAVHPTGKYKKYIGQEFEVADVGQKGHVLKIKIIGDDHVDEELGTGALGVTPAHSMVDFEMYQKQKAVGNDIGLIQVIGEDGHMTASAGSEYAGKTVEEAREKFVAYLTEQDLLEREEDIVQSAGTSDRFKDVVEPLPKTQWFVNVNKKFVLPKSNIDGVADGAEVTLKELMQTVVRNKQVNILPERFDKTYFSWVDNLRDWCISRQIWFGHQIPVWYKGEEIYCGVEAPDGDGSSSAEASADKWTQDPDTLDTWFSSGMWTFSTLLNKEIKEEESLQDWLARSEDFKNFHPTQVLETGYDIIFFWVSRMILMTTYTLGTVPFETVYFHGLVRDEKGRKMSKSLGNSINPLEMIEKYGTDATRLSLIIGTSPGQDMKLSEEKVEGLRNFANKLWNISRFMLMNMDEPRVDVERPEGKTLADKWILSRLETIILETNKDLTSYNFSSAAERLRDFTWNELAAWYLEIAKVEGDKAKILNYILNMILKLWHPLIPFVTETIWSEVYGKESILMVEKFPVAVETQDLASSKFELLQAIITKIRNLRAENNIPPVKKIVGYVKQNDLVENNKHIICALARLESLESIVEFKEDVVSFVEGGIECALDFSGAIDIDAEKIRIEKEIDHIKPYVLAQTKKLSNAGFVDNAPEAVVEIEKKKLAEAEEKLEALEKQLGSL
jgi:valyl-tRNA synthetase